LKLFSGCLYRCEVVQGSKFNFDTNTNISLRLNVRGFDPATGRIDPTPTNLASETGNPTGFGAVTAARPPRLLQLAARFRF
jgi:hypothetical protein